MMRSRIVVDTNLLVSALLKNAGIESRVLTLVADRKFSLCISEPIYAEYARVLAKPQLKLDQAQTKLLLSMLRKESIEVDPQIRLDVCTHEPDNRFVECAEAAGAHYLVTGNKRHFPKLWRRTAILNGREFLIATNYIPL